VIPRSDRSFLVKRAFLLRVIDQSSPLPFSGYLVATGMRPIEEVFDCVIFSSPGGFPFLLFFPPPLRQPILSYSVTGSLSRFLEWYASSAPPTRPTSFFYTFSLGTVLALLSLSLNESPQRRPCFEPVPLMAALLLRVLLEEVCVHRFYVSLVFFSTITRMQRSPGSP